MLVVNLPNEDLLSAYNKSSISKINASLERLIPTTTLHDLILYDAARYALLGGGKRLRPFLALSVCHVFGGNEELVLTPACALEMIHAYSLIHDDLPSMDDDDWRRGIPTVHRKFNEGTAILAGDFLLTYAFEVITNAPGIDSEMKVNLIRLISNSAGGEGMIGGQMMDLSGMNTGCSLDVLQKIHNAKTGALITASALFGAIIARADSQSFNAIKRYAQALGLAFQITDDILDVIASEEKHGRIISSDELNGKSTYVSLLGLQKAKEAAYHTIELAFNALTEIPYDTSILQWLALQTVKKIS